MAYWVTVQIFFAFFSIPYFGQKLVMARLDNLTQLDKRDYPFKHPRKGRLVIPNDVCHLYCKSFTDKSVVVTNAQDEGCWTKYNLVVGPFSILAGCLSHVAGPMILPAGPL